MTTIPLDEEVLRLHVRRGELKYLERHGSLGESGRSELDKINCEIDRLKKLEASWRRGDI